MYSPHVLPTARNIVILMPHRRYAHHSLVVFCLIFFPRRAILPHPPPRPFLVASTFFCWPPFSLPFLCPLPMLTAVVLRSASASMPRPRLLRIPERSSSPSHPQPRSTTRMTILHDLPARRMLLLLTLRILFLHVCPSRPRVLAKLIHILLLALVALPPWPAQHKQISINTPSLDAAPQPCRSHRPRRAVSFAPSASGDRHRHARPISELPLSCMTHHLWFPPPPPPGPATLLRARPARLDLCSLSPDH